MPAAAGRRAVAAILSATGVPEKLAEMASINAAAAIAPPVPGVPTKSAVNGPLGSVHHFAQAIEGATTPPPWTGVLACSAAKVAAMLPCQASTVNGPPRPLSRKAVQLENGNAGSPNS